ncbi:MAG: hypothetical protein IPI91_06540 [Flavobacteriales bacterium]|nr:hypothetical protein [Flavobacteriales bacterium]
MSKVALIIIYNHQFNQNIEVIEKLYKDRFRNIYHLVPFYTGNRENVISVYECSLYFQGYVTQGMKSYFREEYIHYFFIADDLLLNPVINEYNYAECIRLTAKTCFIPGFITLHDPGFWWSRVGDAYHWKLKANGVEADGELPDYEHALTKFQQFELSIEPLRFRQIWKTPNKLKDWIKPFFGRGSLKHCNFILNYLRSSDAKFNLSYPIVGSYSDIFIIDSNSIKQFCHYCGVFAATQLFVEVAIPELKLKGKALWTKEEYMELDKFDNELQQLLDHFPSDQLYLHPVKLSKWNTSLR